MQTLTIKDIARMAGVSPTVVSFVINNRKGVSPDTRGKVLRIIEQTGFTPSISSRRLIMKKSFNIGIIIEKGFSPFTNLFHFEIAQSLLERSRNYGYNLIFTDIPKTGPGIQLPGIIENKDTDGVIFLQDTPYLILQEIENRAIPCVVIDAHPGSEPYLMVKADYEQAAVVAMEYLVGQNHQDIALITSSYVPNFYTQIFSGYRRVLAQNGLAIQSGWIQTDATDERTAGACFDRIVQSGRLPTAVFCATDLFAVGAMQAAKAHGLKIPGDISFVGIDDIILSQYVEPALTTVRIDKTQMGGIAIDMIIQAISGIRPESVTVRSDQLIVRQSVLNRKETV